MLRKGKPVRKFTGKIVRVRFVINDYNQVGYQGKLFHDRYNKYTVLGNNGYCEFRASDVAMVYTTKGEPTLIALKDGKLAK